LGFPLAETLKTQTREIARRAERFYQDYQETEEG
jgi:hypothetical protein